MGRQPRPASRDSPGAAGRVTLARLCGCGRLVPAGARLCTECARRDGARRGRLNVVSGRNTRGWRRLRLLVLERDHRMCQRCGGRADTVHINPRLGGNHELATLEDCVSLCRACHGRLDGGRAKGRFLREAVGNPSLGGVRKELSDSRALSRTLSASWPLLRGLRCDR